METQHHGAQLAAMYGPAGRAAAAAGGAAETAATGGGVTAGTGAARAAAEFAALHLLMPFCIEREAQV